MGKAALRSRSFLKHSANERHLLVRAGGAEARSYGEHQQQPSRACGSTRSQSIERVRAVMRVEEAASVVYKVASGGVCELDRV